MSPRSSPALRIGTRTSALAQWQAHWVAERLKAVGARVELVPVVTTGDVRSGPLTTFGGVGVFTKELQRCLIEGHIDLAVHSLKDLPTEQPAELVLGAIPDREDPGDAFISNAVCRLEDLQPGARVGTGSIRRRAQLLHVRSDLSIEQIRGNVDTRLRKLDEGQYDALVLAQAGLQRLGFGWRIAERLPLDRVLPAVGQGALGIECRVEDEQTRNWAAHLDDVATRAAVTAERALLYHLRAGCLAPVGAWGRLQSTSLVLDAVVLNADGTQRIDIRVSGEPGQAAELGRSAAQSLLSKGAADLIASAHS